MTARRFAIAAILAITIGGPIVEMFDQWDQTLQDGNDTEANAVVAALCAGIAFAVGTIIVVAQIRALSLTSGRHTGVSRGLAVAAGAFAAPVPTISPPALLRV